MSVEQDYKTCPNCKSDLSYVHQDGNTYYRTIGVEDPDLYDGILWWVCPYCMHGWKRFSFSPDPMTNKSFMSFRKSLEKSKL